MLKKLLMIGTVCMGLSAAGPIQARGLDCWCHGVTPEGTCQNYKCACAAPNGKCGEGTQASGAGNFSGAKTIKSSTPAVKATPSKGSKP